MHRTKPNTKQPSRRQNQRGMQVIELAVTLPIVITVIFGAGYLYV